MSSDDGVTILRLLEQVDRILQVCNPKSVSEKETAMMLGGLRHLNPHYEEVRKILFHVERLASLCNEPLSDRSILMVSAGLKILIGKDDANSQSVLSLAEDLIDFSENSRSRHEFLSKMENRRKRNLALSPQRSMDNKGKSEKSAKMM